MHYLLCVVDVSNHLSREESDGQDSSMVQRPIAINCVQRPPSQNVLQWIYCYQLRSAQEIVISDLCNCTASSIAIISNQRHNLDRYCPRTFEMAKG